MTGRSRFAVRRVRPRSCAPLIGVVVLALAACGEVATLPIAAGTGPQPTLPPPRQTLIPTVNIAPAKGWPPGATPQAAPGTRVAAFASGLDHPRWLHVLPNGDVLVAETNAPPKPEDTKGIKGWLMGLVMKRAGAGVPSANRITLLRDTDGDGVADLRSVLLEGLNSPFGMVLVGNDLYVANSDAVLRFPYAAGDTRITAPGVKVVDLPAGAINHHWTKNLIASPDGTRIYVTVAKAIAPDYALGPHTASLGLASSAGTTLPTPFANGMFIGQHGSWNRRPHSGYKVIFVPFASGRPSGAPVDVLTGFLSEEGSAFGRPVGVVLDKQGALLVADDVGNVVWRVTSLR